MSTFPLAAQVHLWWIPLDPPPERLAALEGALSPVERRHADCLRSPSARRRWAAARGSLRTVLAGYAGMSPERLRIAHRPGGRPVADGVPGVHFGLSHSDDRALIAVGRTAELGVDVELIRPLAALEALAGRWLSAEDRAAIGRCAPCDRPRAFLGRWTRREALLKACGAGLPVAAWRAEPEAGVPREWTVRRLRPERGYVGALAVRERPVRLVAREWT